MIGRSKISHNNILKTYLCLPNNCSFGKNQSRQKSKLLQNSTLRSTAHILNPLKYLARKKYVTDSHFSIFFLKEGSHHEYIY